MSAGAVFARFTFIQQNCARFIEKRLAQSCFGKIVELKSLFAQTGDDEITKGSFSGRKQRGRPPLYSGALFVS